MPVSEWQEVTLGDLIQVRHGWPFKSELFSEELSGRSIIVSIGNFQYTGGFRFDSTPLKEYRGQYPEGFDLDPGDILLVMTCQTPGGEILGIPARIPADGKRYLHNQRMGRVVVKRPDLVDEGYLYWVFLWRQFNQELVASSTGTKIVHTAPDRIEAFRFLLPSVDEQRAIGSVLGALDNKIELNRQMNKTLEALAQAVFKSWFVDFDPVTAKASGRQPFGMDAATASLFPHRFSRSNGDSVPLGWRLAPLHEVADVVFGAPFASMFFNSSGPGLPLIRIRDLATHRPQVFTDEEHPNGTRIRSGDIVAGMDGEFRVHIWGGPESWLNQRVCQFVPKSPAGVAFVYFSVIEPLMNFERSIVGTTVNHLGKADLDAIWVVVPHPTILKTFGDITDPLMRRPAVNRQESRMLQDLRDELMPRLLSGNVRVGQAEKAVEGVGA